MSVRIMANVWEHPGINATQKIVLLALADWANDEGMCWPSIQRIADKCCLTTRAVQKALRAMEEMGLLRHEDGVHKSRTYWISLPLNHVHPRTTFTPPLNDVHPTPEPRSPNTSYTHQLTTTSNKSSDDDQPVTEEEIIECWNDLAARTGLPKIKVMNDKRRNMLRKRIKECPDVETWSTAFRNIERSSFLRGDNERGWQADFDFLVQPTSFMRIIEGSYTHD